MSEGKRFYVLAALLAGYLGVAVYHLRLDQRAAQRVPWWVGKLNRIDEMVQIRNEHDRWYVPPPVPPNPATMP